MGIDSLWLLVPGVNAAVLSAWCYVTFSRLGSRRQFTLQLFERFTSPELMSPRGETWRLSQQGQAGAQKAVRFFMEDGGQDESAVCANGLTPEQNVSWLLHSFSALQLYHEAGLVDSRLLRILFEPHYRWYQPFYADMRAEYLRTRRPGQPDPTWIRCLPKLEALFAGSPPSWRSRAFWKAALLGRDRAPGAAAGQLARSPAKGQF